MAQRTPKAPAPILITSRPYVEIWRVDMYEYKIIVGGIIAGWRTNVFDAERLAEESVARQLAARLPMQAA